MVFSIARSRGLVGRYHRFGGRNCLHLQDSNKVKLKISPEEKDSMFIQTVGIYVLQVTRH
jgi:hypothetical protein